MHGWARAQEEPPRRTCTRVSHGSFILFLLKVRKKVPRRESSTRKPLTFGSKCIPYDNRMLIYHCYRNRGEPWIYLLLRRQKQCQVIINNRLSVILSKNIKRDTRSCDPVPRLVLLLKRLSLEVELNREPHQTPLQDAGRSPARASHYKRSD